VSKTLDSNAASTDSESSKAHVTIRPASLDDLGAMVAIWDDGQISQGHKPIEHEQAIGIFRKRVESQTCIYGIWVSEVKGSIAGWQSLHQRRSNPTQKWAESSTYIAKERTGRGIGRKLLTFATEHAKSSGLSHIEGFIQAENYVPIKIVESLGWRKVGSIPRANAEDIEWLYYVYAVPHE
jgi:L-amino acid N-acyltransferase YncA